RGGNGLREGGRHARREAECDQRSDQDAHGSVSRVVRQLFSIIIDWPFANEFPVDPRILAAGRHRDATPRRQSRAAAPKGSHHGKAPEGWVQRDGFSGDGITGAGETRPPPRSPCRTRPAPASRRSCHVPWRHSIWYLPSAPLPPAARG